MGRIDDDIARLIEELRIAKTAPLEELPLHIFRMRCRAPKEIIEDRLKDASEEE